MKKTITLLLTLALLLGLAACGTGPATQTPTPTQTQTPTQGTPEPTPEPEPTPAPAGTDKAILVVSFGTSYNDTRAVTIDAIEADIQAAYPDWEVRRAFTAQTIIDKLAARDGLEIDNVSQALERLIADGYGTVVVQPTHVMPGYEYDDIAADVTAYEGSFSTLVMGDPLLTREEDYEDLIQALAGSVPQMGDGDTAVVFMGHGTKHFANAIYSELEYMMHTEGYENAFVGTVEGFPTIKEVLSSLNASGAEKVVLCPLMIVAGDHANNDMAGDEADSWKTIIENAGYQVECRIQGLGQSAEIRAMIIEHLSETMESAGL